MSHGDSDWRTSTMIARDELHDLVDRLGEEQATEALVYLSRLVRQDELSNAAAQLEQRMGPRVIDGRTFRSQPPQTLKALAVQQGIQPVASLEDLVGDFWPEDETIDDFIEVVRQWR